MKKYLVAATVLVSMNAFAKAGDQKGIHCVNKMYRNSGLDVVESIYTNHIAIKDSTWAIKVENDKLHELVANKLGAKKEQLDIFDVKLIVPKGDTSCSTSHPFVMNCSVAKVDGNLEVTGYLNGMAITASMLVKVQNFELQTTLHSAGPHVITTNGATIPLNEMHVNATSQIQIDETVVNLGFATFFNTDSKSEKDWFACEVLN